MTDEVLIEVPPGTKGQTPDPITYRLVIYRPGVLTGFVGLGLVGVALVLNLPAANGPLAAFIVLWLAILAWNAYWFLVRIAYEVSIVDGSILRWRSITTCREVPLPRVRGMRTWFPHFGAGVKEIIVDGDRSPLLMVSGGFSDVVAMLVQFRPDIAPEIGRYERLAERISYPRAWGWRRQ